MIIIITNKSESAVFEAKKNIGYSSTYIHCAGGCGALIAIMTVSVPNL